MDQPQVNHSFRPWILLFVFLSQWIGFTSKVHAGEPTNSPFVAVFVDDATEKELGPFPYDRARYAQALAALRKAHAKAVVIKYFLDRAKPGGGDDRLADELGKLPVLLQARLDPSEAHPNPYPFGIGLAQQVRGDTRKLMSAQSGWIPLGKFSKPCQGIGFVDLASKDDVMDIPMVLKYQDRIVPSLELTALELAFNGPASIVLGANVSLAGHSLPVDASGQVRVTLTDQDRVNAISFIDVIQGTFDGNRVAGKIAVLGFDAKETPTLPTPHGAMRIHRLFFLSLESLYQQLISR